MRAMVERPVDALDEAEPDCMIVYADGLTIRLRQPLPVPSAWPPNRAAAAHALLKNQASREGRVPLISHWGKEGANLPPYVNSARTILPRSTVSGHDP